jgi:hypothetical protein
MSNRDINKTRGQALALIRFATRHGGIGRPDIKAVLCVGEVKLTATLDALVSDGLVKTSGGGRTYLALAPKKPSMWDARKVAPKDAE